MQNALPANVRVALQSEMIASHTQHLTEVKANVSNSANILRHSAVRMVDESSPATARAVDKILRNPR